MTDVDDVLNQLAAERETYPEFVAAVDADLKVERQRRLAVRQGSILELIAKAFAMGASKRSIMRAYKTKDFATIDRILASMDEQIALIKGQIEEANAPATRADWLEVMSPKFVYIDGHGYDVEVLEDDGLLLIQVEGDSTIWDGIVLDDNSSDDEAIVYNAIREAR